MLRIVLLPAPFSPINPRTSPSPTVRSTPLSARLFPNVLTIPCTCRRGSDEYPPISLISHLPVRRRPEHRRAVVILVERADSVEVSVALCLEVGVGKLEALGLRHARPDQIEVLDGIAVEL